MRRRPDPNPDNLTVWVCETAGDSRQHAREMLVRAVAGLLGTPVSGVRVEHDASGRPRLAPPGAHLNISVSHARGVGAVAVTAVSPVGVDVERIRPLPSLALARRWMSASDAAWVAGQRYALQTTAFLWLWTQKEAISKANGEGLRGRGTRHPVTLPDQWPDPDVPLALRPVPDDPGLVVGARLLPGEVVLGVACREPVDVVVHGPTDGPAASATGPLRTGPGR